MLSENITALAEALSKYDDTGLSFEPQGVVEMVEMLNGMAEDAADLERRVRFKRIMDKAAPFAIPAGTNVVRIGGS